MSMSENFSRYNTARPPANSRQTQVAQILFCLCFLNTLTKFVLFNRFTVLATCVQPATVSCKCKKSLWVFPHFISGIEAFTILALRSKYNTHQSQRLVVLNTRFDSSMLVRHILCRSYPLVLNLILFAYQLVFAKPAISSG